MKCPNCNFEVTENTKFCPECGTKLPETIQESVTTLESANEVSNTTEPIVSTQKKKKSKKKIVLISVLVAVSAVIIFAILLILNPSCMFYHANYGYNKSTATCIKDGVENVVCYDCGKTIHSYPSMATGHYVAEEPCYNG